MRRIAVINQKGGVGKTTTTVHLGAALAVMGRRVLLVDLDPQAHLSLHFGVESDEERGSVYDVLTASTPIADIALRARENLTVVPSDIDLAAAEAELISVPGREVLLREAVDRVESEYDFLLVDCPPSLGVLTLNALTACEEVLIPLQAQFLALQGLGKLLNTVALVRQRINPRLRVSGVVLCMHEAATKLSTEVVEDLSRFLESARGTTVPWSDARIFETRIRRNIKLAEASSFGQTVFEYAEKSNGALDYALLAREVLDGEAPAALAQSPGHAEPGARNRNVDPVTPAPHAFAPQADDHVTSSTGTPAEAPLLTHAPAPPTEGARANGSDETPRRNSRRTREAAATTDRASGASAGTVRVDFTASALAAPVEPRMVSAGPVAPTPMIASSPEPVADPTTQLPSTAERNGKAPRRMRKPAETQAQPVG